MTGASLAIVVPVYNEEAGLGPALDELLGCQRQHGEQGRVGPPGAARLPRGGKGAAVKVGMLAAKTDLAVFVDADMATPPDQLPLLVEALRDPGIALGRRFRTPFLHRRVAQRRG